MYQDKKIWAAVSDRRLYLLPEMANRHGLIAGATGTGKTITMKVLAESFSDMGVPVFLADIKGDLSGMLEPGKDTEDMRQRIARFGIENFQFQAYPTRFWDIFDEDGSPIRVSVADMGPVLLSRLLGLTEIQQGVLNIVFRVAEDNDLLLINLDDLRAMVKFVGDNRAEYTTQYGNVSAASIGAIQRALLAFEDEGGQLFFGEPSLNITDWMRTDRDGRGYINILNSQRLVQSPTVYATFLLWMMTELFDRLPEVGDVDQPRLVFFFDEAHLLFSDCPKALVQKIVQVVKLIRSKGVGIYFISQSPSDLPDDVLAQISNRVQHALRAYTPAEQKAVRAAARAFRENPAFDTEEALMGLGVGEALVSFLDEKGVPTMVEKASILPPQSLMGPCDPARVDSATKCDEFFLKYHETVDRDSAFEMIAAAEAELARIREEEAAAEAAEKQRLKEEAAAEKERLKQEAAARREAEKAAAAEEKRLMREAAAAQKAAEKEAAAAAKAEERAAEKKKKAAQQAASTAASTVARSISTNLVNSVLGGKKTDGKTIAKRAATNALNSLARSGSSALIKGLFGKR